MNNLKIKDNFFYIALDGDSIGAKVGRAVIANDVEELHKVSARIDAAQDFILHWCKQIDGIKISGGGDEATMAIPKEALSKIEDLRKSVEKSFGYTISVGVGKSLSEAGTALLVAKLRGKNRTLYYNTKIKEDIKKAKRRVREGRASQQEYKLSEAYLEKSEYMPCNLHKSESGRAKVGDIVHIHMPKEGEKIKGVVREVHTKEMGMGGKELSPENHFVHVETLEHGKNQTRHPKGDRYFSPATHGKHNNSNDKIHITPATEKSEHIHKSEAGKHNPQDHSGSKDPCPYCADNEDLRTDDCQMCQDLDAQENADGTAGMDGCPACQEYDAANQTASGVDDCPYCQQENITEEQANPDQHSCNCPNCPNSQGGDAQVDTTNSDHPDDCPECNELYSQAVENQPGQTGQEDPNLQGHETAEQVLNLLDKEPGSEAAQAAKKIDNTEMPQGDQMKDGTSVKDNFGQAQRNDVPDSDKTIAQSGQESGQSVQIEDQPDMSQVLQSGLDDHANEQKKQQVLDMVGQTLAGFKANKASLEATKEQNQPLYNSCIQMLKSMIELCKLLGLQPPMTAPQDPATVAESTQSDGPVAPKAAAPSEGAAQDPKTQG